MRLFPIATVVAAFAVSTIACSAGSAGGSTTNGNQGNGPGSNGATSGTGSNAGTATGNGAATCDGACALYLGCKGIDTADNHQSCASQCAAQNHTQDELSQFVSLNCADAVALIDGPPANNNSGGSTGSSSGSSCDRCQWDGSSCIWLSPNAPVTPACDANCCPGH